MIVKRIMIDVSCALRVALGGVGCRDREVARWQLLAESRQLKVRARAIASVLVGARAAASCHTYARAGQGLC